MNFCVVSWPLGIFDILAQPIQVHADDQALDVHHLTKDKAFISPQRHPATIPNFSQCAGCSQPGFRTQALHQPEHRQALPWLLRSQLPDPSVKGSTLALLTSLYGRTLSKHRRTRRRLPLITFPAIMARLRFIKSAYAARLKLCS